jgi:hypothetical protein
MGIALWATAGVLAFALARVIPITRSRRWTRELLIALLAALALGTLATALDFGGWRELEWRAATFAFCGAFAAVGALRLSQRA